MIQNQPNKTLLRQYFRAQRMHISSAKRVAAGCVAAQRLVELPCFVTHETFGCYVPFGSEFDTWPMIHAILQANKRCYLPVLATAPKTMHFARYQSGSAMQKNAHGILEPTADVDVLAASEIAVIIMPMLAFDRLGHRLGLGAGYYDKALSFMRNQSSLSLQPFLLGVAFACQEAASLPHDPWDIPLNAILTEEALIVCK